MNSKTIGLPSYNIRKKTYSDGTVELTSYSLIRKRHKLENQEKIIKPKTDIAIKQIGRNMENSCSKNKRLWVKQQMELFLYTYIFSRK